MAKSTSVTVDKSTHSMDGAVLHLRGPAGLSFSKWQNSMDQVLGKLLKNYRGSSFHYVPFVINRSAVMDLHLSRSCATLIQSLYDIFVHSLMLSVHIVLSLPRPLLPFILPSSSNRCTLFPLIICPKYWHFLFLIVFNNDLLVFILCKTSPLVLCSFHDILNILLYSHISKASNLPDVTLVSAHVSAPYKSVDQI